MSFDLERVTAETMQKLKSTSLQLAKDMIDIVDDAWVVGAPKSGTTTTEQGTHSTDEGVVRPTQKADHPQAVAPVTQYRPQKDTKA